MEESQSSKVLPVGEHKERWQPRQLTKQVSTTSSEDHQDKSEDKQRQPAPLPFGKIDVVA